MLRFRPKREGRKPEPDPSEQKADGAGSANPASPSPPASADTPLPDHIQRPKGVGLPVGDPPDRAAAGNPSNPSADSHAGDGADDESGETYEGYEAAEDPALRPIAADERACRATAHEFIRSADGEFTREEIRDRIVDILQTIYDPEIPVDIYQLGLIYSIDVRTDATVHVEMTLTSPACPVAGTLPPEVEQKVATCDGIDSATVEVVWDPPWNPGMMTESARLELGFF